MGLPVHTDRLGASSTTRPPRELWHRDGDVTRYEIDAVVYLTSTYLAFGGVLWGLVPLWAYAAIVLVALPRAGLAIHELMHVRKGEDVHPIVRLMLYLDAPLTLGYDEYRAIHMQHHRHPATVADPEWYQIRGGPLRAAVAAFLSTEIALVQWVRSHGIPRQLWLGAALRLALFVGAMLASARLFLVCWLLIRLSVASSQYLFHRTLHQRASSYGTYPLPLPRYARGVLAVLLGSRNVPIVCDHDAHHAWPQVRAEALPGLLARYPRHSETPREASRSHGRVYGWAPSR